MAQCFERSLPLIRRVVHHRETSPAFLAACVLGCASGCGRAASGLLRARLCALSNDPLQLVDNIPSCSAYYVVFLVRVLAHFYPPGEVDERSRALLQHFVSLFSNSTMGKFNERLDYFVKYEARTLIKLDERNKVYLPVVIRNARSIFSSTKLSG